GRREQDEADDPAEKEQHVCRAARARLPRRGGVDAEAAAEDSAFRARDLRRGDLPAHVRSVNGGSDRGDAFRVATFARRSCDDRGVQDSGDSGRLAGQLGNELAHLLRCDAELAMVERMPEIRRTATEAAVLAAGIFALIFALAGGSWAAGLGLAKI